MFRRLPVPLPRGRGSSQTGWSQSVREKELQLRAEMAALEERLRGGLMNGEPAAYKGVRVFEPEQGIQNLDYLQDGASSAACNYVVRDGQTYDIPIRITGPGVFGARYVHVAVYKRLFLPPLTGVAASGTNQQRVQWINYVSNMLIGFGEWTTKFSLWPAQPFFTPPAQPNDEIRPWNCINFFWNLFDGRNNDYYSDELLSHQFLLPRTSFDQFTIPAPDGGLHEFDVPLMCERDSDIIFQFRPITPVFQFDSSVDLTGLAGVSLPFDDRENGRRIQTVRVEVELIGTRWITDQDVVQTGAMTPGRGSSRVR